MNAPRFRALFTTLLALLGASCFDEKVVAPDDVLPPVLAIDRPTVQLFRFARGRKVAADTVRISNNGEGPLGIVEQVGGVDYITTARVGWLRTRIENLAGDQAILILEPSYAEDEQEDADVAEVVLKARGSPELKRVKVIARTLRGASFEFSVSPLAFAAIPGDPAMAQNLTVRNGGNGALTIHDPSVRYLGKELGWLSVARSGGSDTAPEYLVVGDPGDRLGGLYEAFVVFESPPDEETRARPDSVRVQLNVGQPILRTSAPTLTFTVVRGGADPPAQTVRLSNSGEGPTEALGALGLGPVTYGEGANGWLEVSLSGHEIEAAVQTDGLLAGDYSASFTVLSEAGGTRTIQVTLSVEAPILTPSSRTVSFGMVAGSPEAPAAKAVRLSNTGSGTFDALGSLSLGTLLPDVPWLDATLAGDSITLGPTPASSSLPVGDHTTRLPVRSEYGGNDTLFVNLTVSRSLDPPDLALSATQVEFSGISGDPSPPPQEVQISNAGGGSLGAISLGTVTYAGQTGWLNASLAGTTLTLTATTGTLPDGIHLAAVTISSESGGSASIEVSFGIGSPILTASTTSASFSALEGGADPADQSIELSNTGPGSFASLGTITTGTITYAGLGGWLSASYANGTLTLSVSTGSLAAGAYEATIPVSSAQGGAVTIGVAFTVRRGTDVADLVASPNSVRMDGVRGGADPPSQFVRLSNGGGGSLGTLGVEGITYAGVSGWLSASLAGDVVTLDASTGSLAAGSYDAQVTLTSTNGGAEVVDVSFVVSAPVLTLAAHSASFSGEEDGLASPASMSIGLSNTGAGNFGSLGAVSLGTISYAGTGGWLSAGLAAGNTSLDLASTIGVLAPGTYTATVPVNSTAGGSETVSVTLTVTPLATSPSLALSATTARYYAEEGGGDPAPQDLRVSNSGGGGLDALGAVSVGAISYGSGDGWLSASLSGSTLTLSVTTGALTAAGGPYTALVPVQTDFGGTLGIDVTFSVSVPGGVADLQVSPSSVRLDALVDGSDPPDQEVHLYNAGSGPLGPLSVGGITYGEGTGWLDASVGGSTLTLRGDITSLSAGTYSADVEVQSGNGGSETVAVTLVVAGPDLTLSTASASFSGEEGGTASPATVSVLLSNTGAGQFSDLGTLTLGTVTYGGATGWLVAELVGGGGQVDLSGAIGALGPGTYPATVPVNSTRGGSESIGVTLTVRRTADAPAIAVSASAVGFTALLGGGSPAPRTVTISNGGGGTVGDLGTLGIGSITYGGGETGWLSTTSLSGSNLTVSPVTGALPAGTHVATIPVLSQFGGEASVSVTVEVETPVLTASTRALSLTGLVNGAPPAAQTVTFANTGAGSYGDLGTLGVGTVSYGPEGSGWLDGPSTGDEVDPGGLDFIVDQAGLGAGRYSATVPVSSQYGGSETISVSLSVVRETDPPSMVLSPTTQRFDALVGGADPPAQTVLASNAGGGSLGVIQVSSPLYGAGATGWLTASVNGNTITTRAQTGSLAQGTYTATVPVSSDGGTGQISVTLVVGTARLTLSPRSVSFGDTVGGVGPTPTRVTIANTGGGSYASLGTISVQPTLYGDGADGWLQATRTAPDSVRVQAVTDGLPSRTLPYEARVPVASTLGGTDTILVAFTVAPGTSPPRLALSLDSLVFAGILGGDAPEAQTVAGFNSGGGELGSLSVDLVDYVEGDEGWLADSVGGQSVTLWPVVEGLSGGTHRASVTVGSENGGQGNLGVILILSPPVLSLSSAAITFSDTVGSPDTLRSQVFISNTGAGNRASLGPITLGTIAFPQGRSGWLSTHPGEGEAVEGFTVAVSGSASDLPEGTWSARIPVGSVWGGVDTLAVTFSAREPDRSFDLPSIQLVKDSIVDGKVVLVPLPGDSVVLGPVSADTVVRVGVRNGSATRVNLSGLRVGIPTYPEGQQEGWITGAFLDRTTATFDEPAELVVVVAPGGLAPGRYEGRLVVSSENADLQEVAPRILRVILVVG